MVISTVLIAFATLEWVFYLQFEVARLNITVKISALLVARMEYVVYLNDIIYECRSNIIAYIISGTDILWLYKQKYEPCAKSNIPK